MSYSGLLIVFVTAGGWVAGCASASSSQDGVDASAGGPDSSRPIDAANDIDAPVNSVDAPSGCTTVTRNLLTNPAFDMTPMGMGWVEAPIDPAYPIVTADGTIVQTSPNKAWMGGLARANANDSLYQEVTIPASTTALSLSGYYEVRTAELFGVYDRGKIELVQPNGTLIQQAFANDNTMDTTAWTPLSFTFSSPSAGQTVRLRLSTASDSADATSFYFDSLSLSATYCE